MSRLALLLLALAATSAVRAADPDWPAAAGRAKAEGKERVIVFNNCGHGFLDLAISASRTAAAMAWFASGAGRIPSVRVNSTPRSKVSRCGIATASMAPFSFRSETSGAMP